MKFSTTGDSCTDWCGITLMSGQPNVLGVADVMIERDDGVKLVVWEVNLASSAGRKEGGPGEFQLLAELYTHVAVISATPEGSGCVTGMKQNNNNNKNPRQSLCTLCILFSYCLNHDDALFTGPRRAACELIGC